jgi:hypothetical protein
LYFTKHPNNKKHTLPRRRKTSVNTQHLLAKKVIVGCEDDDSVEWRRWQCWSSRITVERGGNEWWREAAANVGERWRQIAERGGGRESGTNIS